MTMLSDQQIETELDAILDSVRTGCEQGINVAPVVHTRSAIRQAFVIGLDQGCAKVLAVVPQIIADTAAVQLQASMTAIGEWIDEPDTDRSLSVRNSRLYTNDEGNPEAKPIKVAYLWQGASEHRFEGSDRREVLAKAATWIANQKADQATDRDTHPAPPQAQEDLPA